MPTSAAGRAEVAIARETGGMTVIVAEACELALATTGSLMITGPAPLVAVTTTGTLLVTLGAVKNPLLEIVPALTDQVTAVFGVPLTLAVNCNCSCDARVALPGESESMAAEGLVVLALCEEAPHAAVRPVRQSKSEITRTFGTRFFPVR